ncbi:alpha/beta hydrolase-fold protein [Planctomyces sp. SH-PL14]|uniref:carboxylesterase family protein n=1 Tax=Planctomyces sp. SH-PL14 TaxID=1632864 RepID=UPI00078BF60D|nr:alpha/beta hydrolase-fold protein [Planctomyces sp. SH-PL14]AMV17220.1 Phospholipase/Carboxylesterase [Planctomyces sp. SH-PL14]
MRVLLCTLLFCSTLSAGESVNKDSFEKHVFEAEGASLPYRLLKPANVESGKKYPVVVFLHGAGERGTDNEKQLVHGMSVFLDGQFRKDHPCFVVVPQCPDKTMWVDIPWDSPQPRMPEMPNLNHKLVIGLLDRLEKELPVDVDREYAAGLSMGGFGTWDLLIRNPKRFAAGVVVCGGADLSRVIVAKDIPLWLFHGAKDTTVRVERSREAVETLKKIGATPRYTEYPDVAHDSWNNAFATPELYEWLFTQKRTATP